MYTRKEKKGESLLWGDEIDNEELAAAVDEADVEELRRTDKDNLMWGDEIDNDELVAAVDEADVEEIQRMDIDVRVRIPYTSSDVDDDIVIIETLPSSSSSSVIVDEVILPPTPLPSSPSTVDLCSESSSSSVIVDEVILPPTPPPSSPSTVDLCSESSSSSVVIVDEVIVPSTPPPPPQSCSSTLAVYVPSPPRALDVQFVEPEREDRLHRLEQMREAYFLRWCGQPRDELQWAQHDQERAELLAEEAAMEEDMLQQQSS